MVGGAIRRVGRSALGHELPRRQAANELIRADIVFLAIELVLLGLLLTNLYTSSASHAAAAALIVSGPYASAFWGVDRRSRHPRAPRAAGGSSWVTRIPHTVVPALLVLAGGFTLRWVMVSAGQASHVVHAAGM